MSDLIRLLLQAEVGKDSISGIKTQLESLEKNIKPIKIDIEIDKNALQQIQNLNKTLSQSGLGNINATSSALTKNINGVVKGLNVVAVTSTKTWKNATGEMTKFAATTKTLGKTITENFDGKLNPTGSIETDNSMAEAIKLKNKAKADEIKLEKDWYKAIKMNVDFDKKQMDSIHSQALQMNKNIDQLDLFKQKMVGNDGFSGQLDIFAEKFKGKYDTNLFTQLRKDIDALDPKMGSFNNDIQKVKVNWDSLQKSARESGNVFTRTFENMGKFMRFYLAGGMLVGAVNAMKNGVKSVIELDASLTELSKVSELTNTQLSEFTDRAYDAGKTIGRTGKDVIDATSMFKRAGFELESAFELSQQALLLTNIGDGIDNVTEASSSLIAILKGFKMEAEETAHVVDALNEVSNNYAIDTNNLTKILERTSGTLGQTGTTYEQLLGLATGGFETLRNAEMVASGINMITMRLKGMEESGEAVEGLIPKIQESFDKYTDGAVSIIDKQNGGLNSTYEILQQLSKVYSTLTDEEMGFLNEAIAGTRQNKVLVSIMENWENVEAATLSATNSLNSANIENEKYLNSINGKLAQLTSSTQKFWYNFIDSDAIKGLVDGLNSIVTVLDSLINNEMSQFIITTGLLATTLGLAEVAITKLNSKLAITKTLSSISPILSKITSGTITLGAGIKELGVIMMASPFFKFAIIAAGIVTVIKVIDAMNVSFKEQQEIVATLSSEINTLQTEYDSLNANKNRTAEQERYLKLLEKELEYKKQLLEQETKTAVDKYFKGTTTTGVDGQTYEFRNSQADKIKEQIAELQKLEKEYIKLENSLSQGYNEETAKKLDATNKKILELKTSLIESQKPMQEWLTILGENAPTELKNLITKIERAMYTEEEWIELNKWMVAEEIANQVAIGQTTERMAEMERTLLSLGFTSDDVANILGGNIDFVKDKYKELDTQQIINLQTIETLDATQKQTWINYLNNSKTATKQLIEDTKSRIKVIMAEAQALAALTGGKVNASVVSKKGEIDPKTGLLSNLSTVAQNQAIDAQRELVNLESNLREIEKALVNVSNIEVDGGGIDDPKDTGKEQYKALYDRYTQLNLFLDKNNVLLAK
ncbi:MAG: phage tail tape measure protein, partial [Tissierellia bacterium]|nr:phage tail tape measure protein [Tissierellia bacterium]